MDEPTHAGCVVVRDAAGGTLFLLVKSRNGRHWVLPKGHVDPGETPAQAAVREVREEAGVLVRLGEALGVVSFSTPSKGEVRSAFFLAFEAGAVAPQEDREVAWLGGDEAAGRLSFAEYAELVRRAAALAAR